MGAALLCLSTTFDAFARRQRLAVRDRRDNATGILDKGPGGPTLTTVELHVDILVAPGDERCRALVATGEKYCIVSHAGRDRAARAIRSPWAEDK